MDLSIKINCQISDPHTESEIVEILNQILPWMADNVVVFTKVEEEKARCKAEIWLEYADGSKHPVRKREDIVLRIENGDLKADLVKDKWKIKVKKRGYCKNVVVRPEDMPDMFAGLFMRIPINQPVHPGDNITVNKE